MLWNCEVSCGYYNALCIGYLTVFIDNCMLFNIISVFEAFIIGQVGLLSSTELRAQALSVYSYRNSVTPNSETRR